jgi:integrase/recombinase XerD
MSTSFILNTKEYAFWKEHCEISPKTKRKYTYGLKRFERYLAQVGFEGELNFDHFFLDPRTQRLSPITKEFIDEFIDYLIKTGKKGENHHILYDTITALRNYFNFLDFMEMIEHNPMKFYRNPYYKRELTDRSISIDETRLLLHVAKKMDPFHKMYFVIILLLVTTGLRNMDIRKLKISNVNFENKTILVEKSKSKEVASVYMTQLLADELKRYINHPIWQQWAGDDDKELFFNPRTMKPYTTKNFINLIKRIAKKAGIKKNVTPHTLRFTAAMILLESGFSLKEIQTQLRHKSLATTLRYLKMNPQYTEYYERLLDDDDCDD